MNPTDITIGPYRLSLGGKPVTYELLPEAPPSMLLLDIDEFCNLVHTAVQENIITGANIFGLPAVLPGDYMHVDAMEDRLIFSPQKNNCSGVKTTVEFIPSAPVKFIPEGCMATCRTESGVSIRINFLEHNGTPAKLAKLLPAGACTKQERSLFLGPLAAVRTSLLQTSRETIAKSIAEAAATLYGEVAKAVLLAGYEVDDYLKFNLTGLTLQQGCYVADSKAVTVEGIMTLAPVDAAVNPSAYLTAIESIIERYAKGAKALVSVIPSTDAADTIGLSINVSKSVQTFNEATYKRNVEATSQFVLGAFLNCFSTATPPGITHYTVPILSEGNRVNTTYAVVVGTGVTRMYALMDWAKREEASAILDTELTSSTVLPNTECWMVRLQLKNQIN